MRVTMMPPPSSIAVLPLTVLERTFVPPRTRPPPVPPETLPATAESVSVPVPRSAPPRPPVDASARVSRRRVAGDRQAAQIGIARTCCLDPAAVGRARGGAETPPKSSASGAVAGDLAVRDRRLPLDGPPPPYFVGRMTKIAPPSLSRPVAAELRAGDGQGRSLLDVPEPIRRSSETRLRRRRAPTLPVIVTFAQVQRRLLRRRSHRRSPFTGRSRSSRRRRPP